MPKNDGELEKNQPKSDAPKSGATAKKPKSEVKSDVKPKVAEIKPKAMPEDAPVVSVKQKTSEDASKHVNGVVAKAAAAARGLGGSNTKSTVIKAASVLVALIAVVVLVFGVLIYVYKSESQPVAAVASVVPYPVEVVNGKLVSYNDYLFQIKAEKNQVVTNAKLNNQAAPDFNSTAGKQLLVKIRQNVLDKLKQDAVVAQLASQKHVTVTDKEINDTINKIYDTNGGKVKVTQIVHQVYGWNINDLRSVVRSQLLAKNLSDKVTADPAAAAASKAKAEDVLNQVKAGGDFTDLAKKNSQASDAASGGDLGYFTKGQLPDNLQVVAEALQPGQVSDVVKTQYGFEILKVIDKKDDGSIHAQHILIQTIDFTQYLNDQVKKAKVNVLVKA